MSNIPVGLQLFTLREETSQDFTGTLKKVAEMGYKAVEFAGYGGIEAKEMKRVLDDLGLIAPSSHVIIKFLEEDLQKEIDYALEVGVKYIVLPVLSLENRLQGEDNFKSTIESLQRIGEACRKHGLGFAYHNHATEFQRDNGEYILDRLFDHVPADLMQAELDLYWVKRGGEEPETYLKKYAGRCPLVHVKDMTGDERQFFAEVGHGVMDYQSILATAKDAGVEYFIVEQDRCDRPPLESVKMSIDYLKSIGIA